MPKTRNVPDSTGSCSSGRFVSGCCAVRSGKNKSSSRSSLCSGPELDSGSGGSRSARTGPGSVGWGGSVPPFCSRAHCSTICRTARFGAKSRTVRGSFLRNGSVPCSLTHRVIASRWNVRPLVVTSAGSVISSCVMGHTKASGASQSSKPSGRRMGAGQRLGGGMGSDEREVMLRHHRFERSAD